MSTRSRAWKGCLFHEVKAERNHSIRAEAVTFGRMHLETMLRSWYVEEREWIFVG